MMKNNIRKSWICSIPVAHRGLHNETMPENSLTAFENAAKYGYSAELDVHLLADGEIAVFHDYSLKRMTGKEGFIKNLKADDLKSIYLLNKDNTVSGEHVPTLKEVLKLAEDRLPLQIEIKYNDGNMKDLGEIEDALIETLKGYSGEYCFISFHSDSLRYMKKHVPQSIVGILSDAGTRADWDKLQISTEEFDFIDYYHLRFPCEWLSEYDCPILCYTIRSQAEYERAKDYCDNCVFENFMPIKKKLVK